MLSVAVKGYEERARIHELLAGEPNPTLGGVAGWADALRYTDPDRFKATAGWHYINAKGGGCAFVVARDCPDGNCVVAAIEAQRRVLADRGQSTAARRDALKFLVHFIADIHQPLHAGTRPDAGGNQFQISLRTDIPPEAYALRSYVDGVMGTNLHAVWDYYVLADAKRSPAQYTRDLARLPGNARSAASAPLAWAKESCALTESREFYPDGHVMTEDYLRRMRPVAEERVRLAALRLAAVLNEALDAPPSR